MVWRRSDCGNDSHRQSLSRAAQRACATLGSLSHARTAQPERTPRGKCTLEGAQAMLTQVLILFLGTFLLIAGVVSAIGPKRLLIGLVALPFVAAAAAVATAAL